MPPPLSNADETTIGALLREGTLALRSTIDDAEREAQLLLAAALGTTRARVLTHDNQQVEAPVAQHYRAHIARRARGEPIAYITGHKEFWSLDLLVTPATLIPRPETEVLVEHALQYIPSHVPFRIADLGTGSGAIALALAHERPHARIVATDISKDALAVAQENVQRLGLRNVEFRHGGWFECLASETFDMICSNPPYVAARDPHLARGDLRFEPASALTTGHDDDLSALRHIAEHAMRHLAPDGILLLEHGHDQRARLVQALEKLGFATIEAVDDFNGTARLIVAHLGPTADSKHTHHPN